jgi:hypothetical protein
MLRNIAFDNIPISNEVDSCFLVSSERFACIGIPVQNSSMMKTCASCAESEAPGPNEQFKRRERLLKHAVLFGGVYQN